MKQCNFCKRTLLLVNFNHSTRNKDGVQNKCRNCEKKYRLDNKDKIKQRREQNRDVIKKQRREFYNRHKQIILIRNKEYYLKKKENIRIRAKQYRDRNKETLAKHAKRYREANKDQISAHCKLFYKKNRMRICERVRRYQHTNRKKIWLSDQKKLLTNAQFKLKRRLRSRLWCAIKTNYKIGSAVQDLGCSIPELKIYLEKQFQEGMGWDNWGHNGWHIDHKIPLASFNLQDKKQFLEAVYYTNLQPLWAKDNLSKSDKIFPLDNMHMVR